jgi:hypothetical protein
MAGREGNLYWEQRGLVLLWLSVLSGPAAWALNQLIGYALVKPVCAADAKLTLTAVSAGALIVVAAGAWVAWSCLASLRGADERGGRREDRSYFMAVAGISLNALIGLLIVTAAVAPFLLSPCE